MITPSGRKVTQGESTEKKERERENAVNSGQSVQCSAHYPLGPTSSVQRTQADWTKKCMKGTCIGQNPTPNMN